MTPDLASLTILQVVQAQYFMGEVSIVVNCTLGEELWTTVVVLLEGCIVIHQFTVF